MPELSGNFEQSRFSLRKIPMLEIKFSVTNQNGKNFQKTEKFWVDSGFDGDLKMPQSFGNQLKGMRMPAISRLGGNASGSITYDIFKAKIIKITLNGLGINNEEIDCALSCFGTNDTAPLIGLNALSRWKTCLDLPNETLSVS
ncbi:MAG: hypothetical protein ACREAK_04275 [Nitrosarchaeum sp.]